jgi:hypothetical protein
MSAMHDQFGVRRMAVRYGRRSFACAVLGAVLLILAAYLTLELLSTWYVLYCLFLALPSIALGIVSVIVGGRGNGGSWGVLGRAMGLVVALLAVADVIYVLAMCLALRSGGGLA